MARSAPEKKKSYRHLARRGLCLAATLIFCVSLAAAESGERFYVKNDITCILRLRSINEADEKVDGLLRSINPHSPLEAPVISAISQVIKNPGMREIPKNAFWEFLVFDPNTVKGDHVVSAFPIADQAEYRKLIGSQTGFRQEGVRDDITSLVEDRGNESQDYFLTTTSTGIAIFGKGRDAVSKARDLYDRVGKQGVFHTDGKILTAFVDVSRLTRIYEGDVKRGLSHFREDLLADIVESPETDHPLSLIFRECNRGLLEIMKESGRLSINLDISAESITANGVVYPATPSLIGNLFDSIPNRIGNPVAACFPKNAVMAENAMVWPEFLKAAWDAAGNILLAGLGTMIDKEDGDKARAILKNLEEAGFEEIASATLPPPAQSPSTAAIQLKILKFALDGKAVDSALKKLDSLVHSDTVQEIFDQNNLQFKWEYLPDSEGIIGRYPIGRLRVHLGSSSEKSVTAVSAYGRPRDYLFARTERELVLATCQDLDADSKDTKAIAARGACMSAIRQTLKNLEDPAKGTGSVPAFELSVYPMEFVRAALEHSKNFAAGNDARQQIAAINSYINELSRFPKDQKPIVVNFSAKANRPVINISVPVKSVSALGQACLGIASTAAKAEDK